MFGFGIWIIDLLLFNFFNFFARMCGLLMVGRGDVEGLLWVWCGVKGLGLHSPRPTEQSTDRPSVYLPLVHAHTRIYMYLYCLSSCPRSRPRSRLYFYFSLTPSPLLFSSVILISDCHNFFFFFYSPSSPLLYIVCSSKQHPGQWARASTS